MLKRTIALTMAATMLLGASAFAQTDVGPGPSQLSNTPTFITQEEPGQWRASRLERLNVYNNNDQRIGAIRDLVVDRDGHVDAVVIGVGGFLGIEEHDVAVPFDKLTWAYTRVGRNAAPVHRANPDHAVLDMTRDQLLAAPEFTYAR